MKLPISWLGEYLEYVPEAAELAERLTLAGLEVEEVRTADPRLIENLVIARIDSTERHPNADRLTLCTVNDGTGARPVVCGATNMTAGDVVVLAKPGAVLPGGLKIKKSEIRGAVSEGMLCSASELGLADDHSGILVLERDVRPGESAAARLGLDDCVLEIGITPNRGDCLSIIGLAREISAVCGVPQSPAFHARREAPEGTTRLRVEVDDPDLCPMYRGIEVRGVAVGPSPAWLVRRLAACGIRSINNVVDVTNLILLDVGQPLHAFDGDLLVGDIVSVRRVESEMDVASLDDQVRRLVPGDLAIWDSEGPVAIAGVMGGARTAVHEKTRNLFLESAFFQPATVRRTSRRLGLVSESSYRFERGVDPSMVEEALLRAAQTIAEVSGGRVTGGVVRSGPGFAPIVPVVLRASRIERILGAPVGKEEAAAALRALGATVQVSGKQLEVVPPSHRSDLSREVDLIEEIARLHGYDAFPDQVPTRTMALTPAPARYRLSERLRVQLGALGLSESIGLAFASAQENELFPGLHAPGADAVRVRNPLRSDAGEMRKSLLPGLLSVHRANARNGVEVTDVFAIGRTFSLGGDAGGSAPDRGQVEAVAGLLWGPRRARGPGSAGPATFWDVKGVVEGVLAAARLRDVSWHATDARTELHPRAAAEVRVGGQTVGYLGRIHPDVAEALEFPFEINVFEVDSRKLLEYAPRRRALAPIPRFPASSRDVSLLVPEGVLAGAVTAAIDTLADPLIERVRVFDEYAGEGVAPGHRALAFSITYRASERTLTDEEVTDLHARVIDHLVSTLGVRVRV